MGAPASSNFYTDIGSLLHGYQICAASEGKSPKAISAVTSSVKYFQDFLVAWNRSTGASEIGPQEIRTFILYLQQKKCFSNHRLTPVQDRNLSGHTINTYLRGLRIFFSWLVSDEVIEASPFDKVKIPRPPRKIIPTFTDFQIQELLAVINTGTPRGFRDHTIILTLLDTGLRVSELCHLKIDNVWLEEGVLKVLGKGNKERLIPIGKQVQRLLWRYISRYRAEPLAAYAGLLFLTRDGTPTKKDMIENMMTDYGRKAGLQGVRCSPHTLRHTAAVKFLRNGGDVFSLQHMLGHSQLEVLRGYINLAQSDISRVHQKNSPADNLDFQLVTQVERTEQSIDRLRNYYEA
jgi:site-specific recombinase XerD